MKTIAEFFGFGHSKSINNEKPPGFLDHEKSGVGAQGVARPTGGQSGTDFRTLKATLPADEFKAVQWAARNTSWLMPDGQRGKSMPLADWLRTAVLAKVRETVKAQIERGKAVPPDIAALIDRQRAGAD